MERCSDYHVAELRIAQDPSHPGHILPKLRPHERVLDVGCGAGQTLIAACPGHLSFGLDVDLDALKLGRSLTAHVAFVCGRAEQLPFAAASFDAVVSRVTLPYTDIRLSLGEIFRVLRPGGRVWLTLHTFRQVWNFAVEGNHLKGWIFFLYIVLNSLLFHLSGRQFPFFGQRMETFQTQEGIRRALARQGFDQIHFERSRHFVVEARKGRGNAAAVGPEDSSPGSKR